MSVVRCPEEGYPPATPTPGGNPLPDNGQRSTVNEHSDILARLTRSPYGGDLDKVTGKRCTFAAFPWRWKEGDGCIIRLVAMIDKKGSYRIERGSSR